SSQILRIGYQGQDTDVQQFRLGGALEFENGRFQFGVETRETEMHQRTSGGTLTMGDWSASAASQDPGMVAMLTPYNLSGLFGDFNSSGSPTTAFRANATQLGLWAIESGHIGMGRDPNTLVARPDRLYTNWSEATAPDGELRYN